MSFLLRKIFSFAFLAALGCTPAGQADSGQIVDDLGASIELGSPARRIVSLSPSLTEMLFTLGLGDRVVGRTDWGSYPPEALEVASVGAGLSPNVEVVAARAPDLVLFYRSTSNASAIAQFQNLAIPSASFLLDSLGDVTRVARIIGSMTGEQERADSLASAFGEDLELARNRAFQDPATCEAVIVVWDSPPMVIGGGSFLSELLGLAGGRNIFEDVSAPDAEVSIESIAARDPDVVVVLGDEIPGYAQRREWKVIEAVNDKAFVLVSGSQFEYASFRSLEAAAELRTKLEVCTP
jgi:iron complex transport system substrate-binding protein